jgi:hypothetical protein
MVQGTREGPGPQNPRRHSSRGAWEGGAPGSAGPRSSQRPLSDGSDASSWDGLQNLRRALLPTGGPLACDWKGEAEWPVKVVDNPAAPSAPLLVVETPSS